jgi:superfamily II DNA helicase RecQ
MFPLTSYEAICDSEGTIVTDLALLKTLAEYLNRNVVPVMVTKKVLVGLATYKPQDKDSFVNLAGSGEKLYDKCGERFITLIKQHLEHMETTT